MLRYLLLALIALTTLTAASAQTTPTTKRSTATKQTGKRNPAKKKPVKKKTTRTATKMGAVNNTMRPNDNKSGQARDDIGPGGNGAVGSREPASGKGQGVYAAPGMAVKTAPSANSDNYRGEAPKTNPRQGNTLGTPAKGAPAR